MAINAGKISMFKITPACSQISPRLFVITNRYNISVLPSVHLKPPVGKHRPGHLALSSRGMYHVTITLHAKRFVSTRRKWKSSLMTDDVNNLRRVVSWVRHTFTKYKLDLDKKSRILSDSEITSISLRFILTHSVSSRAVNRGSR